MFFVLFFSLLFCYIVKCNKLPILPRMKSQQCEQTKENVLPFPMPREGKEVESAKVFDHFTLESLAVVLAEKQTKGVNGEVIQLVSGAIYVRMVLDAADDG